MGTWDKAWFGPGAGLTFPATGGVIPPEAARQAGIDMPAIPVTPVITHT
jgi:hypothetical protein